DELRRAVVETIEAHLSRKGDLRQLPEGKEFHFMGTVRFSVPTRYQAYDLAEFADGLRRVSVSSLYLHIFEARLRPPLGLNDFSLWFDSELGEAALAKKVSSLDPYTQTLEGLRARIIGLVEKRLEVLRHA
ncbi:MAG TPA: DUF5752 family protein, partial [Elusimicrobiota bacterium]|nr:DUF5752 family protein [Elusimicrobiota bacterium]